MKMNACCQALHGGKVDVFCCETSSRSAYRLLRPTHSSDAIKSEMQETRRVLTLDRYLDITRGAINAEDTEEFFFFFIRWREYHAFSC